MLRYFPFALILASSLFGLSCSDTGVVQTGSVEVQWDMVNGLIVEAMQAPPVCLTLIEPEDVTDDNQPDLWAANGLARTTDGGYYYECVGGWWWGYWGWYWDSCASWYPVYVEYDVGNLLIPVGPPPGDGEEPAPIFGGLAQSVVGTGADAESKVRFAVDAIFAQWPDPRTCPQSP